MKKRPDHAGNWELGHAVQSVSAGLSSVVSLQKLPKDVVKKVVLQMEEQKLAYEEKALVALQRATQEKTEAIGRAEALQVKRRPFNMNNEEKGNDMLVCVVNGLVSLPTARANDSKGRTPEVAESV